MKQLLKASAIVLAMLGTAPAMGQERVVLRAAGGQELWGNVIDSDNKKSNGIYRFGIYNADPQALVTGSKVVANAGSVYFDGRFRFISADYSYADQGYVSANLFDYTVNDNEWVSSGRHTTLQDDQMGLLGVETAFDRATGKVYGVFYKDKSLAEMEFGVADYDALTRTTIGSATRKYVAIGLTADLVMYGVAEDGNLYRISTDDGTETLVGSTGLTLLKEDGTTNVQSGEIDQRDGTFYWAATDAEGKSALYTVDLTTGAATKLSDFTAHGQMYALTVPYPIAEDDAPANVTNLKVAFEKATTSGTVTFRMPAVTFAGDVLDGETEYRVIAGTDTISGVAQPGERVSVAVTGEDGTECGYTVWAVNGVGAGPKRSATAYCGMDSPSSLQGLTLSKGDAEGQLVLSWDEPLGRRGGYVGEVVYTVLRNATDTVAKNIVEQTFTETMPVEGMNAYNYKVVALCNNDSKVSATSNTVVLGDYVDVPFVDDFSNETRFGIYTVEDVNGDGFTWKYRSYTPMSACYSNSYTDAADDWLLTPPVKLAAGKIYAVRFCVSENNAKYTNKLEVKYGEGNTAAELVNTAFDTFDVVSKDTTEMSFDVVAEQEMLLRVGFHVTSEMVQGNLYVFGISVTENGVTGITEAKEAALEATGNVYSLDGRLVKTGYTSADTLPKGIYLINGRKVVIK